jgi:hypothetical protein
MKAGLDMRDEADLPDDDVEENHGSDDATFNVILDGKGQHHSNDKYLTHGVSRGTFGFCRGAGSQSSVRASCLPVS